MSDRKIISTLNGSTLAPYYLTAGSLHGGVLSPTLWNIGYNPILEKLEEKGYSFSCFADDTLGFLTATSEEEIQNEFKKFMDFIVRELEELGLLFNTSKTQTLVYNELKKANRKEKFWKNPVLKFHNITIPLLDKIKIFGHYVR